MDEGTRKKLTEIGYDDFFEEGRKRLGWTDHSVARVVAEYREAYRARGASGELLAKISGKQRFSAITREDYPAVGDFVAISEQPEERAIIHGILPRKTILKKKYSNKQENQIIATNIDTAFIVESMDRDYNLNRFERYLVLAEEGKIVPVIILNKTDLISEAELALRTEQLQKRFKEIEIIQTSIVTKKGLNELLGFTVQGKTYCFLGSSGVGKSSLINNLLGKDEIETREISMSLGRGRHTTTTREMYFLKDGGIVIDNPGTREVGIADSETGIETVFDEITSLSNNCKFSNCTHEHEPGCAVLEAVESGALDSDRYKNYVKLKKESEYYEMSEIEKREKDRKFGKLIKKVLEKIKED